MAALLAALAGGCVDDSPGWIVGDAYIADLTTERNLGAIPVRLLPDRPAVDSALMKICQADPLGVQSDSAARTAAWRARGEVVRQLMLREVTADAGGAFVLDTVPPGRYRLWADTVVNAIHWTWLQRVRVVPGDTVRANLSNSNPDEDPFRCAQVRESYRRRRDPFLPPDTTPLPGLE